MFNVLLVDEINGTRADDTDLTGNNDAIKVTNTVARVIEKFLKKFPHSIVRISGNTAPKQLLYQRKIYQVDKTKYMILGNSREGGSFKEIERPVNKTGVYHAFLVYPT
ncbi:MAG: DUF6934 family protein [Flavisolibacter sp.]